MRRWGNARVCMFAWSCSGIVDVNHAHIMFRKVRDKASKIVLRFRGGGGTGVHFISGVRRKRATTGEVADSGRRRKGWSD